MINTSESEKSFWMKYGINENDEECDWDICSNATHWWGCRCLTSMHLQHGPNVQFWIKNEVVHIRWDNTDQRQFQYGHVRPLQ